MSWVWQNSPAKGTELLLLLAIADSADDRGANAFPSVTTLARKTRMSRRTVQRLITTMADRGLITVRQAGGRDSNRYTLVMTDAPASPKDPEPAPAGPVDTAIADPQQHHQPIPQSTGGVKMTQRQNDTGDTALSPLGCHSHVTPGVTQLCHPNHPVPVLYPSTEPPPARPPGPDAEQPGGGGDRPRPEPPPPDTDPDLDAAADVLRALGPGWNLGPKALGRLTGPTAAALAAGWHAPDLLGHLGASPDGVRSPYAVLAARLADLPAPPARPAPRPPWCGTCDRGTRLLDTDAGVRRCPTCHPLAPGPAPDPSNLDHPTSPNPARARPRPTARPGHAAPATPGPSTAHGILDATGSAVRS